MPEITKNQLKHVRLLKQKKYRQQYGEFVVEGEKNVSELLNSSFEISAIFATTDWDNSQTEKEVTSINSKQLSQLSFLSTPDKVVAVAKIPVSKKEFLLDKGITLCLDSINDPGNLGTIIRTADWFGIKRIICSPTTVDCYNPKTVMATKGSLFHISVIYQELKEVFEKESLPVYGAYLDGTEISTQFENEVNSILLMGSESHGISPALENYVSHKIKIPKKGNAESLNVAMATSILLYQFTAK